MYGPRLTRVDSEHLRRSSSALHRVRSRRGASDKKCSHRLACAALLDSSFLLVSCQQLLFEAFPSKRAASFALKRRTGACAVWLNVRSADAVVKTFAKIATLQKLPRQRSFSGSRASSLFFRLSLPSIAWRS